MRAYAGLLRVRQWTKNLAVFAALVFARRLTDPASLAEVMEAFVAFCLASSAAYIVNDIRDRDADRLHPVKSRRPIAAGAVGVGEAWVLAAVLVAAAFAAAALSGVRLVASVAAYLALQAAYNLKLKHVPTLEVFALAAGFVIRVAAGAWILAVEVSPWLLLCTMNLALFLALAKRRHELIEMEDGAGAHRKVLDSYSPHLLDQMISIVAAATVVTYALYTLAEQTVRKFGSAHMIWTTPFVILGVFRYLYLIHQKKLGGSPEWVLLTDLPILATVVLWAATAAAIVYL
ncbi:MAG: decaprenyl-phosphate phosphoribosyltransferase [Lentisphaerae bacterium]|nr:decaprenyl-phosphate phosphoribosyltransferase [Lentisphaerota bacterium]